MTTPAHEDDRRRRGFLLALFGGALLLLLGLFGGWLAFGDTGTASPRALGGSPSPSPSSGVTVVLPTPQPGASPSSAPVVGTTEGQPASEDVDRSGNGNGNGSSNPGHPLSVSGEVNGSVGPGTPATLVVTITNPNNQAVVLTSVGGAVTSVTSAGQAGKPACSVSWYHVGSFAGARTIARNSSTTVSLPVTFDDLPTVNQDNCKGAQYTFSFTAQARQA